MPLLTASYIRLWVPQAAGNEDLIPDAIVEAVGLANQYCGREFEHAEHDEYIDVDRDDQSRVIVRHAPVTSVTAVYNDAQDASPTLLGSADYSYDPETGVFQYNDSYWAVGMRSVRIQYTAGYTTLTLPPELKLVLRQIVAWVIGGRGDVGVSHTSADGLSQTRENQPGILPASLCAALNPWRRPCYG